MTQVTRLWDVKDPSTGNYISCIWVDEPPIEDMYLTQTARRLPKYSSFPLAPMIVLGAYVLAVILALTFVPYLQRDTLVSIIVLSLGPVALICGGWANALRGRLTDADYLNLSIQQRDVLSTLGGILDLKHTIPALVSRPNLCNASTKKALLDRSTRSAAKAILDIAYLSDHPNTQKAASEALDKLAHKAEDQNKVSSPLPPDLSQSIIRVLEDSA